MTAALRDARRHMKTRPWLRLVVVAAFVTGCGSDGSSSEGQVPSDASTLATTSTTMVTTSASAGIVGRWKRVHECAQLVNALDEAGLLAVAPVLAGEEFFPGTSAAELARKDDLCQGAEPFVHYHFFDARGQFGSLDENENQVDDGPYEIINSRTLRIGPGVVFHYEIDRDTLTLSPVITQAMKEEALANPRQVTDAGRAVAVAYPGEEWKRVGCGNWC
jgi:hypothetical protein